MLCTYHSFRWVTASRCRKLRREMADLLPSPHQDRCTVSTRRSLVCYVTYMCIEGANGLEAGSSCTTHLKVREIRPPVVDRYARVRDSCKTYRSQALHTLVWICTICVAQSIPKILASELETARRVSYGLGEACRYRCVGFQYDDGTQWSDGTQPLVQAMKGFNF